MVFVSTIPLGHDWRLVGEHHLEEKYRFRGFRPTLEFVKRVWRRVKLAVWTHTIDGLTESGFIWAVKADDTLNGWESICDI